MATNTIVLLCRINYKVFCYVSSNKMLCFSRSISSNHTYSERSEFHKAKHNHGKEAKKYSAQFKTLELSEDSNRETVRRQYVDLVKKYHPDTAKDGEQNLEKFQMVDQAYKDLQKWFVQQEKEERDSEGEYGLYYKVRCL